MPAPRKYSDEFRAAVVRECLETANCAAVGRKYGISAANAIRYVKEAGEDYPELRARSIAANGFARRKITSLSQLRAMVADYENQAVSVKDTLAKWGLTGRSLAKYLREAGVTPLRDERRRHKGREDAFAHAEGDPEAAYWIGMLMADGCVSDRQATPQVALQLSGGDGAHVEAFRQWMGWAGACHTREPKPLEWRSRLLVVQPVTTFSLSSHRAVADLATYGVVPRKSATAEVKRLERNRYFWLGVVCGDGGVCVGVNGRVQFYVCGSHRLMGQFAAFIAPILGRVPNVFQRKGAAIGQVNLKDCSALPVIRHLFAEATFALPRKLAKARTILARSPI